jgi:hypothetical protein
MSYAQLNIPNYPTVVYEGNYNRKHLNQPNPSNVYASLKKPQPPPLPPRNEERIKRIEYQLSTRQDNINSIKDPTRRIAYRNRLKKMYENAYYNNKKKSSVNTNDESGYGSENEYGELNNPDRPSKRNNQSWRYKQFGQIYGPHAELQLGPPLRNSTLPRIQSNETNYGVVSGILRGNQIVPNMKKPNNIETNPFTKIEYEKNLRQLKPKAIGGSRKKTRKLEKTLKSRKTRKYRK